MSKSSVYICDVSGKGGELKSLLSARGFTVLDGDGKAVLDEADFLVLAASDARQLEEREVAEKYNYFLDEIRWKRKASGEIVIVDCSDVSFSPSRLSYALKKCKRFRFDRTDELAAYIGGETVKPEPPAAPSYTFAGRDEERSTQKREMSGCKHDHVFGEEKKDDVYSNIDKLKEALAERKGPVVKDEKVMAIVEEARQRLEEKRKAQESDPKLNPQFESKNSNPFKDYPDGKKTETSEKKDKGPIFEARSGNPFEDYPDYPKNGNNRPAKSNLPGLIIGVAVIIIFLIIFITAFTASCDMSSEVFWSVTRLTDTVTETAQTSCEAIAGSVLSILSL